MNIKDVIAQAVDKMKIYKTEKKTLSCVHSFLRNHFGKATFCMNEECKKKSKIYEWCKKTESEYTLNPEDYLWLCRSCHRRYDLTPEKRLQVIAIGRIGGSKTSEKKKLAASLRERKRRLFTRSL